MALLRQLFLVSCPVTNHNVSCFSHLSIVNSARKEILSTFRNLYFHRFLLSHLGTPR